MGQHRPAVKKDAEAVKDLAYWLSRPPEERLEAMEILRSQYYRMMGWKSPPRLVRTVTFRDR